MLRNRQAGYRSELIRLLGRFKFKQRMWTSQDVCTAFCLCLVFLVFSTVGAGGSYRNVYLLGASSAYRLLGGGLYGFINLS